MMAKPTGSTGYSAVWSKRFFGLQNVNGVITDPSGSTTSLDSITPIIGSNMTGATANLIISGTEIVVQVQRPSGVLCSASYIVDLSRGVPT